MEEDRDEDNRLTAHPYKRNVMPQRYISEYERELHVTLRALSGYRSVYIPQDKRRQAAVDLDRCRHETQADDGPFTQCPRYWTEKINGFGFCDMHAERVYKYLGTYY